MATVEYPISHISDSILSPWESSFAFFDISSKGIAASCFPDSATPQVHLSPALPCLQISEFRLPILDLVHRDWLVSRRRRTNSRSSAARPPTHFYHVKPSILWVHKAVIRFRNHPRDSHPFCIARCRGPQVNSTPLITIFFFLFLILLYESRSMKSIQTTRYNKYRRKSLRRRQRETRDSKNMAFRYREPDRGSVQIE